MPELPDIEGFRRVAESAASQQITDVRVYDASVLHGQTAGAFRRALTGRWLGLPERHGKWLLIPTSENGTDSRAGNAATGYDANTGFPALLLHFGMTGVLLRVSSDESVHRHDRVVWQLDDEQLRYRDMRKLQGIRLVRRAADRDAVLADLGPDAAVVSKTELRERLGRSRRQLKPALMDQARVAGLGNITVDEVLWRARLPPTSVTADLADGDWGSLHRSMRSVLRQSSRVGRVPERPSWLTGHRDEQDPRCPRCSTGLRTTRVGGRSTLWCPRCQPSEE